MKLLVELNEEIEYLEEGSGAEKKHYVEGVFMRAEHLNKNGRIYPINVLEKAVENYRTNHILKKNAYGQLDHPDGPNVSLKEVAILIESLSQVGNDFVGKAIITDTPNGNIAKGLIRSGAKLGISSRGMGSLKETSDGSKVVGDDFRLVTAGDLVSNPSADVFLNAIQENVDWVFDPKVGWKALELAENIKKEASKRRLTEEEKLFKFAQYLKAVIK